MLFRRYASLLVSTSILVQSVFPTFSMEANSINEINSKLPLLLKYRSIPAPLNFKIQPQRTGAGVLHWSKKDGKVLILLGKRNDGKGWSNLGGESDDADCIGLQHTAAREVCEESNGIYAHHPRLLRKQPFIAIYSPNKGEEFLHYMYWQEVQYLEKEIFNEKVKEAKDEHSREYSDFMWVESKYILQSVKDNNKSLKIESENIDIFDPLFTSLSTLSGVRFLEELVEHQKIRRFNKEIRPLVNRLYIDKNQDEHADIIVSENKIAVHWEIPKYRILPADVSFGKNAFGKFWAYQQFIGPEGQILSEKSVVFDAKKEEDIFAEAVSAHGAAMVELKQKWQVNKAPKSKFSETWNPSCDETLSQIHLRIALGNDYKKPEDFLQSTNQTLDANLANIKYYFEKYDEGELKRVVKPLESDYNLFAQILEWEKENGQWPTFFHAASARMNNLIKSFTSLRRIITLCPLNDLVVLRGTDAYFKNDKKIQDMLNRTGAVEDPETKCAMIFMNYVLLAGLKSTRSTSSSAEYVLNNHSVEEQNIVERFKEAMALAGFSNPEYVYYNSLFEQYFAHKNPDEENSMMLAVSQNPKDLDDYNYSTICGRYYRDIKGEEITSSLQIIKGIQNEYERQKNDGFEPFSTNSEAKAQLIPENRVFLHPDRVLDPKQTRSKIFDRFPLLPEEEAAFNRLMHDTATAMCADWLAQKTSVMNNAFLPYPACKTLYKLIYGNIAGEESVESFSMDGFMHLLSNNCFDAIDNYIEIYPDILNSIDTCKLKRPQQLSLLNALIPHHKNISDNLLKWYDSYLSEKVENVQYNLRYNLNRLKKGRQFNIITYCINKIDYDNITPGDLVMFMVPILNETEKPYEEFPFLKKIFDEIIKKPKTYFETSIDCFFDSAQYSNYNTGYCRLIKDILEGKDQEVFSTLNVNVQPLLGYLSGTINLTDEQLNDAVQQIPPYPVADGTVIGVA